MYPKPKLLIVNYPHNPSSVTVEPEFFVDVVKLARRYGFMVISDFAYADVAFDGYQPPSFLAAPGAVDVGVEFTTMSKGYNMAGWRVGFCAGNAEMVRALATIKAYYDYGMFQRDPDRGHRGPAAHRRGGRSPEPAIYQSRRDVLCEGLRRIGWDITPPRAGMFVWAKIPDAWAQRMDTIDLRHEACWKRPTWPPAPAAASARPAKAICGWPWWRTKTACGKPCGRSAAAWDKKRASRPSSAAHSVPG